MDSAAGQRYPEIDFFRGLAIAMMVFYHLFLDLSFFSVAAIPIYTLPWQAFARATAILFILIAGLSLSISYSRTQKANPRDSLKKNIRRGLKLFLLGLLITAATYLYIPEGFIIFGILHFLGIATIVSYPFLRMGKANLFLGIIIILIGVVTYSMQFDFPHLLWLGLRPAGFYTLDYFPLLPWLGVFLLGIFLGKAFYPGGSRKREWYPRLPFQGGFAFLGRHSLLVYLVHQPAIVILLFLLFGAEIF